MRESPRERNPELDGYAVGLIQIFFALVLTLSITAAETSGDVFTTWSPQAWLGLFVVLTSFILSWLDWHELITANPYRLRTERGGRWRVGTDLLIVVSYAVVLFHLEELYSSDTADLTPFLIANAVVFMLYGVAGGVRMVWGGRSDVLLALLSATSLIVLSVIYSALRELSVNAFAINYSVLTLLLAVIVGYRWWRKRRSDRGRDKQLALDIDGVLADQISGMLSLVREASGNERFAYEDVAEWDLSLGPIDIKTLIEDSLANDEYYVRHMPLHSYAGEFVHVARTCGYKVNVVSARETSTKGLTETWLNSHGIVYDDLRFTQDTKSDGEPEVLVDDYPKHIKSQLEAFDGRAILIDQPWNRGFTSDSERFYRAADLKDAARALVHWWWTSP